MKENSKDQTPVQRLLLPSYLLWTGRILNFLSPWLASRFAAKLFLTPFRYQLPEREKEMDQKSRQQLIKIPAIDREIMVYRYGKADQKVLLSHGWSGRGTQLAVLARALVSAGYQVVSFDAPAHGKAPGKWSMLPFFVEAIHFLEKEHGPFEVVIGHSLGGMAALRALKEGTKVQKLVIIGTANRITAITEQFVENLQMNAAVATRMKHYFDNKFGEDMDNYSGAVSAREVKIPGLVIHDKQDIDVPVNSAFEIAEALKQPELLITEGLGHRRILGDDKVIDKIIEFVSV